jgi:hypothetical protein
MAKPGQMYDHELNPTKGWPSPYAVDKHGELASVEVVAYRGMVLSLDANAKLQVGLACGAMPIFALNNSTDFDVVGDDGNLVGGGGSVPMMSGLVAVGGYEVESTEFNADETYAPNQTLTAGAPGDADAGVIKPGVAYEDTICGVTSDGVLSNDFAKQVLRFWPVWLPPLECPPVSSN